MFITALDVQNAFDVVNYDFLPKTLYIDGEGGDEWLLLKNLYTDMTSRDKWDGLISSSFVIRHGVDKEVSSQLITIRDRTTHYLFMWKTSLQGNRLERSEPLMSHVLMICTISQKPEMNLQCLMSTSETYANREHCSVFPLNFAVGS